MNCSTDDVQYVRYIYTQQWRRSLYYLFQHKFVKCRSSHSRNKAKNASFSVILNRLNDVAKIRIIFELNKFFQETEGIPEQIEVIPAGLLDYPNRMRFQLKDEISIFYDIFAILLIYSEKHPTFNRHEPTLMSVHGR